jgi:hypothetical protein
LRPRRRARPSPWSSTRLRRSPSPPPRSCRFPSRSFRPRLSQSPRYRRPDRGGQGQRCAAHGGTQHRADDAARHDPHHQAGPECPGSRRPRRSPTRVAQLGRAQRRAAERRASLAAFKVPRRSRGEGPGRHAGHVHARSHQRAGHPGPRPRIGRAPYNEGRHPRGTPALRTFVAVGARYGLSEM